MACTLSSTCPLFQTVLSQQNAMRVWRGLYCDSRAGWDRCERLRIRNGGGCAPDDMLPNGKRLGEGPAEQARR
jgi:hypothetical protein